MSERLLIGTRKGLFAVERGPGGAWRIGQTHFLGDQVTLAMEDPRNGFVYAALDLGHFGRKLHRSEDGGESFQEIASPAYPPKPEGEDEDIEPNQQQPVPWTTKLLWALEAGGPGQEGRLWCGTIPGGLFRSDDGGESWELVRSLWDHPDRKKWFGGGADLPGLHSVCVDPRDPRRVLVGVSCGGAWLTEDDGASWTCRAEGMRAEYMPPEQALDPVIQDPHRIVQCPAEPDTYWTQHHNGIFRSRDGAASWQEVEGVEPSAFGFGVAVHPEDGETAWFVPGIKDDKRYPVGGRLVVNRTRDGGRSFEALGEGLPQEHAYDVVFRHALDVNGTGQRLAFGSTTGSLWVSQDQGDSWQAVSEHLPPIYSVRFARAR